MRKSTLALVKQVRAEISVRSSLNRWKMNLNSQTYTFKLKLKLKCPSTWVFSQIWTPTQTHVLQLQLRSQCWSRSLATDHRIKTFGSLMGKRYRCSTCRVVPYSNWTHNCSSWRKSLGSSVNSTIQLLPPRKSCLKVIPWATTFYQTTTCRLCPTCLNCSSSTLNTNLSHSSISRGRLEATSWMKAHSRYNSRVTLLLYSWYRRWRYSLILKPCSTLVFILLGCP